VNIYIDESGSFVNASTVGAWNAVGALAVPEVARKKLNQIVRELRTTGKLPGKQEIKIKDLTEDEYLKFIAKLAELNVAVFCTATDAGLNSTASVSVHQQNHAKEILRHIDKMKHEGGRSGVLLLASQLEQLPPQLYVQLFCQIDLMFDVVTRAINFYVQHVPATLTEFRWRIDQKNSSKTDFEDAFEKLSPAMLQTRSFSEPLPRIRGFDYSKMNQYEFEGGKMPEYLKQDYGLDVGSGFNIQKLIRGNIKFVDSRQSVGVQAADLVVSGIRRFLRKQFSNNEVAAQTIGKLMLQGKHNGPSINLISFANETSLDSDTARLVRIMSASSKPMIKKA
jgi:transcriptional regulator NrdR family protein